MAFLDFLFGKREKTQEFQRFNPQQEQVLNQLLSSGQRVLPSGVSFLESILSQDPSQMSAFEAPAMRQFSEQIIPGIAERFTSQFGPGSQQSSAFGQQLGAAGASLAERLASQRAGLGLDAFSQLSNLLSGGLGQRSDRVIRPAQSGFAQGLVPGLLQGALSSLSGGLF